MSPKDKVKSEERRRSKSKSKKKKKSRKQHRSSSSPPSSFLGDSSSSSDRDRDKKRKHKQPLSTSSSDAENDHRKYKGRRHHKQNNDRGGKHLRKEDCRKVSHSKRARGSHVDEVASGLHDVDGSPSSEEIVCTMLQKFPELANDLEQLLKMLDDGQAVDLSGLTNEHVAAYLQQLFKALLLHKTNQGLFYLPDGTRKKTLQVIGPALRSASQTLVQDHEDADRLTQELELAANKDGLCVLDQLVPCEQGKRMLGPAMPSAEELEAAARLTEVGPLPRMLGPAMPSAEELEAAARLTKVGPLPRDADEDPAVDSFVGPPPPAAVKEAESANEAERYEEVDRILAPDIGNAYELLGLRVGATAESLKKRYWKLSLLVHPDKCTHPQAHQAFTTLNKAFKDLQDPTKRSIIDQKIEEKEEREEFEAELKAKREAAQWRKLRGEPLPGDDDLLDPPKVLKRDEWMTQLPPERKAGAPSQQSTFFSRSSKSGRGDTSVWTDTPLEKAQKAKMAYLEAHQYTALTGDTNDFSFKEDKDPAAAGALDHFNLAKRGTSLLEKHQLESAGKVKKSRKKETLQPAEWSADHPWKPWDREKDLASGRKAIKLDKSNMAEGLSSRFSSSHKERTFL